MSRRVVSRTFRHAPELVDIDADIWPVGDNAVSDLEGASAAGIRGIAVHHSGSDGVQLTLVDTVSRVMGSEWGVR